MIASSADLRLEQPAVGGAASGHTPTPLLVWPPPPPTCCAGLHEGLQGAHKLRGAKVEGPQALDASVRAIGVVLAAGQRGRGGGGWGGQSRRGAIAGEAAGGRAQTAWPRLHSQAVPQGSGLALDWAHEAATHSPTLVHTLPATPEQQVRARLGLGGQRGVRRAQQLLAAPQASHHAEHGGIALHRVLQRHSPNRATRVVEENMPAPSAPGPIQLRLPRALDTSLSCWISNTHPPAHPPLSARRSVASPLGSPERCSPGHPAGWGQAPLQQGKPQRAQHGAEQRHILRRGGQAVAPSERAGMVHAAATQQRAAGAPR